MIASSAAATKPRTLAETPAAGVDDDDVGLGKGIQLADETPPLLVGQVGDLREARGSGDDLDAVFRVQDDLAHGLLLADHVVEVVLGDHVEHDVDVREPEIRVHHDHFLARFGVGDGQVHRNVRLSDAPLARGDGDDPRLFAVLGRGGIALFHCRRPFAHDLAKRLRLIFHFQLQSSRGPPRGPLARSSVRPAPDSSASSP